VEEIGEGERGERGKKRVYDAWGRNKVVGMEFKI
jgi:hypothetical protein